MLTESSCGPQWYAVQTKSNFEKTLYAELCGRDICGYLPVIAEMHRWKDRQKLVEEPVFPGYVFARFYDEPTMRLQVLRTRGAVRILGAGNSIEPVPATEIENLRLLLTAGSKTFAHPFLREGAWVRVKRGPLKGVEGILAGFKNRARLVLSIDLLCRSVATEIEAADVEVLRQAPSDCHTPPGIYQYRGVEEVRACIQI